jgi:hypothetical protein
MFKCRHLINSSNRLSYSAEGGTVQYVLKRQWIFQLLQRFYHQPIPSTDNLRVKLSAMDKLATSVAKPIQLILQPGQGCGESSTSRMRRLQPNHVAKAGLLWSALACLKINSLECEANAYA